VALRALQMTCNCDKISKIDELEIEFLRAELKAAYAQLKLAYYMLDIARDLPARNLLKVRDAK
jgi:hypothetical protein